MTGEERPLVSIVMIAYNVAPFIAESIESVVLQKTNFKFELVIGEDCSTDSTRSIIEAYQKKYPEIIKTLYHKQNLGLTPNCVATHNACNGKYIALLDSDDYWTNTQKLQLQVDFLENNPEYMGCAHQSMKIYVNGDPSSPFGSNFDTEYGLIDTITHRKFHTSSLIYRKYIWDQTGGIPPNISSNERAIYPMIAIFGKIKYFGESMCVYRLTGSGLSSRVDYKELQTDFNMIPWLKKIDSNFPVFRFKSFIHLCCYTYGTSNIPFSQKLKHYLYSVCYSFSYFPKNLGDVKWATIFLFKNK